MFMIIAIIYMFLSYEIFDQQLKTTFRKSSTRSPTPFLKKSTPLLLLTSSLKICASPPLLPTLKIFQAPPAKRSPTLWDGGHHAFFSKNGLILPNFGLIK